MTVFSFGAGQESIYLLHRLITEPSFYKKHVIGELLVVGSDTGDEHPHTYKAIEMVKEWAIKFGFEFHWVTSSMGYHPTTWKSLTYQYKRNKSIGSAAFRQTCTDNLKVKVVDNFVEQWLSRKHTWYRKRKTAYHYQYLMHGKIRLILGFAKGEEKRTSNGNKYDPVWKKQTVERYYPLIEEGIDRQECITYNTMHISQPIWPSNCMRCFYQSDQEVLWLYRFYPDKFKEWFHMEQEKLIKYLGVEKNYGVYGKITLQEKLEKAQKLYGHMTDEELNEYKFSHGHCIKSKY